MRPKQPKAKQARPSGDNYVRLLEQSLRATQTELSRERSNTDKYSQCLREQLDRALGERDATKRELARAIDQLISYAGRAPISDEASQAIAPAEIVDALFAATFGEDEGNSMFPRKPELDEESEKAIQ